MVGEWDTYVKRTGTCRKCQREFTEQESYQATLVEIPEGFERRDYCRECWTDEYRRESFSSWQARVPKKEEKKRLFVDDQVLMDFFRRLAESDEEGKSGFRFVLALILMRKRLLKYGGTETKDGVEIWVMRPAGEDREYKIPNPHLDDEQIEKIRTELSNVLAGD